MSEPASPVDAIKPVRNVALRDFLFPVERELTRQGMSPAAIYARDNTGDFIQPLIRQAAEFAFKDTPYPADLRATAIGLYVEYRRSNMPVHIADEPPEVAQKRATHLQRSAEATYRKIEKVYDFAPLPDATAKACASVGARLAHEWADTPMVHGILEKCGISGEGVEPAMAQAMQHYLEIYQLQKTLADLPLPHDGYAEYGTTEARDALAEIYANHRTNEAEAKLMACGMDALSAHHINGLMIRLTIDAAYAAFYHDAHIEPEQQRPKDETHARNQIDTLRHHWQGRVVDLTKAIG